MSFTDDFDPRFSASFYEVHSWSSQGRILVINKPHYESSPVVTEVLVNTSERSSATVIVALALASAGDPAGEVFEHDRYGQIVELALPLGTYKAIVKGTNQLT